MRGPEIEDKPVAAALFKFVFPFSLEHRCQAELTGRLLGEGFVPFRLRDTSLEDRFYGEGRRVSHRNMERYFLPFTNHVLFPHDDNPESFRRLSAEMDLSAILVTRRRRVRLRIHSVDMILCPFDTGFLTLRTEIDEDELSFSQAVEFADRFRSLKDASRIDRETHIDCEGSRYQEIDDFLLNRIVPQVKPYIVEEENGEDVSIDQMPFMMDDRMFVTAFYQFPESAEISVIDRYRAGRIDGTDGGGRSLISATHLPYIRNYCRQYGYDRWAPDTYLITDENCFACLTRLPDPEAGQMLGRIYGEYYYGLLLNLFHRIVLLKLSNAYSHVHVESKEEQTVDLIREITTFSAKYDFVEAVSQNTGKEIFLNLRKVYNIDVLFKDVRDTLNDLYQFQESQNRKRSDALLTILTIYAVVSGIYGMNQVIEELKGSIDWSMVRGFSLFEWIALTVALSGLLVGSALAFSVLWKWLREWISRRSRR